jgi:hypothetical protein
MRIVFDISRMRPGCAIIQAGLGGSHGIADHFPSKTWLLAPTEEMRCYDVNDEQLAALVAMVGEH